MSDKSINMLPLTTAVSCKKICMTVEIGTLDVRKSFEQSVICFQFLFSMSQLSCQTFEITFRVSFTELQVYIFLYNQDSVSVVMFVAESQIKPLIIFC